jgi:hypothetical protein
MVLRRRVKIVVTSSNCFADILIVKDEGARSVITLPGAFSWKVFTEGSYSLQRSKPIAPCEVICLAHFLRSPQPLLCSLATPPLGTVRLE